MRYTLTHTDDTVKGVNTALGTLEVVTTANQDLLECELAGILN